MKTNKIKKINKLIENFLKEDEETEWFIDNELRDNFRMTLQGYGEEDGLEKYTLDDTEFYKAEDETLYNAIEVCIEEEFAPFWGRSEGIDVEGYEIEDVQYDEDTKKGYVQISLDIPSLD